MTVQATVDLEGVDDQGTAPAGDAEATDGQGDPADLGDAGRRALQAERTARAEAERLLREAQQQLTTTAARVTELETENGTLTTQVVDLGRDGLRYRIAVEAGLPPEAVNRLQGDTEEALLADAQQLLALMGARPGAPTVPRPDPSQGSRTPAPTTPEAAFKAAMGPLLNP